MNGTSPGTDDDARLIAALLAIDPAGLGGVWLRARHGPARDALVGALTVPGLPERRISASMDEAALFGGVDLTASLGAGRVVERGGLLAAPALFVVNRAEALSPALAGRVATKLDEIAGSVTVLIDGGTNDDPLPPASLRSRLAFFLDETTEIPPAAPHLCPARTEGSARLGAEDMAALVTAAAGLGIDDLRPVLMAASAARAHALLCGRSTVTGADLATAARLVFAHRALPALDASQDPAEAQPQVAQPDHGESDGADGSALKDMMVEAARTALPPGLLAAVALRARMARGHGQGDTRVSPLRGRPVGARPGRPGGRSRLDLVATLQAAAPWQRVRSGGPGRVALRGEDLRLKRYLERSERLIVFLVDASGSAAMARLAEAKGAAETLLAKAYESRDSVCLCCFRDDSAELLLPPTRSLARAKTVLGAMRAGGRTPLARGLVLGGEMADRARRLGQSAQIVLMTDGRANVAIDGAGDRQRAQDDARLAARRLRATGTPVTILDSGRRATQQLQDLAQELGAEIVGLPRLGERLARGSAV